MDTRHAAALAAAVLATGCVILPPDEEPTCDPTCCGGPTCCEPCPPACDPTCCGGITCCTQSCASDAPRTVDQLWAVRIDPGTANLAALYASFVVESVRQLHQAGFDPRGVAVMDLYRPDRGPVYETWANVWLEPPDRWRYEVFGLEEALRAAALAAGPAPDVCPGDALAAGAPWITGAFGGKPAALLAGVLDHAARPRSYGSCAIGAARYAADDPATWLSYPDGPLERRRIRYAVLATREDVSWDTERQLCLAVSGFPRTALDVVAPSPLAFFDPFAAEVAGLAGDVVVRQDPCDAAGGAWSTALRSFAPQWRAELGIPAR